MPLTVSRRSPDDRLLQSGRKLVGALAFAVCLVASQTDSAHAITTGFLPGDACFGSDLSGATIAQIESGEPVRFGYNSGAGMLVLCGYAGYWNLDVHDMPKPMQEGLARVYEDQRQFIRPTYEITLGKDGTEHRRETNPFFVLIYNRDYDIRHGIGLKLNENWMNLVDYRTGKTVPGAYSPYVDGYHVIARDWRLGPKFPGLKINETDAKPLWGPQIDEPLTVNAADIQILLLPDGIQESHALATARSLEEEMLDQKAYPQYFYRVTSDGVTECHWNEFNKLIEKSWPADEATLTARQRQATLRETLDSLERALSDTYGIDDETLPDDVRKRLEELRNIGDAVLEDLEKLSAPDRTPPASEVPPDSW